MTLMEAIRVGYQYTIIEDHVVPFKDIDEIEVFKAAQVMAYHLQCDRMANETVWLSVMKGVGMVNGR
jgi:hypothetical protein